MVVSLGAGVVADGRMLFLVVVVASVSVIVGIVAISIFLIIIETAGLEAMPAHRQWNCRMKPRPHLSCQGNQALL